MPEEQIVYDIGDRVRLTGTFTADLVPSDPSEVKFQIRHREDTSYTEFIYDVAEGRLKRLDTGVYYIDWTWERSGTWYYRFVGEGVLGAAEETKAKVAKSKILQR